MAEARETVTNPTHTSKTMKSMEASKTPAKRSRTSGKHSRNGCGTCKIRRVKCDETKPICRRCQNFKITCDGYGRVPGSTSNTSLSGGLPIAPKPLTSSLVPSIQSNLSIDVVDNEEEYRYFSFFRDKLLFELTQFAHGNDFRTLILQACNIPSIRHTMIALAALGKTHSILQTANTSTTLPLIEPPEVKTHREYSIRQYAKGLDIMKKAIAAGEQDLRTTLLTCLLIICIECLHGNFAMAGVQVSQGMALLRDWRQGFPNANLHPIGFSSPAPQIIEDSLVQMLGGLEIQTYSFDFKHGVRPEDNSNMEEGINIVRNMPAQFESINESRLYLELLLRRSKHWLFSLESFFKPLMPVENETIDCTPLAPIISYEAEPFEIHKPIINASKSYHVNDFAGVTAGPKVHTQQAVYIDDLNRWKASLDNLMADPSKFDASSSRWREQVLVYKAYTLILKTVAVGDEMIFDKYTKDMTEILDLAEAVLNDVGGGQSNPTTFTIFQRCTGPPHFVGLHCRVGDVRRRAIKLLDSLPKTPALSDSLLMSAIVQWVMELEEAEMIDGEIPGYARIRNVAVSIDMNKGESTLSCTHRVMTEEGPVEKKRRKKVIC